MRTVYLDMDGVVADFNKYAQHILKSDKVTHSWPDEDWDKIKENHRLYSVLDRTPEADNLVKVCEDFCEKNNYQLLFLTAVPKGNDVPWAYYDKVIWATNHYPSIPVMFGPYSKDKWKHCQAGDILIDDRPSNCQEWALAGGISILHEGNLTETVNKLNAIQ